MSNQVPKSVKDRHNLKEWIQKASKVVREQMDPEEFDIEWEAPKNFQEKTLFNIEKKEEFDEEKQDETGLQTQKKNDFYDANAVSTRTRGAIRKSKQKNDAMEIEEDQNTPRGGPEAFDQGEKSLNTLLLNAYESPESDD